MTVPMWPIRLPPPLVSGYSYNQKAAMARTEMDSGIARSRRRFSRAPAQINLKWLLEQDQLAVFEYFWHFEVLDGASWFDTIASGGVGPQYLRVRCVSDGYTSTAVDGGYWEVSIQAEALEMPKINADQYAVMKLFDGDDIVLIDRRLHRFLHVLLPGEQSWGQS